MCMTGSTETPTIGRHVFTQAAFDACAREGVLVMPADPFYPTRSGPAALRLSFGDLDDAALLQAAERLTRALS